MRQNPHENANLATFTEEPLMENFNFCVVSVFCSFSLVFFISFTISVLNYPFEINFFTAAIASWKTKKILKLQLVFQLDL